MSIEQAIIDPTKLLTTIFWQDKTVHWVDPVSCPAITAKSLNLCKPEVHDWADCHSTLAITFNRSYSTDNRKVQYFASEAESAWQLQNLDLKENVWKFDSSINDFCKDVPILIPPSLASLCLHCTTNYIQGVWLWLLQDPLQPHRGLLMNIPREPRSHADLVTE